MTKADLHKNTSNLWYPILVKHGFKEMPRLITRREEKYKECTVEYLVKLKKDVCVQYSKNRKRTEWERLTYKAEYHDYFCYGWLKDKSIGDYVILNVAAIRSLRKAGHLKHFILNRLEREYKNGVPYSFIPIPISVLNSHGVIAYHSDNHPALLDT